MLSRWIAEQRIDGVGSHDVKYFLLFRFADLLMMIAISYPYLLPPAVQMIQNAMIRLVSVRTRTGPESEQVDRDLIHLTVRSMPYGQG